MKNFSKQLKEKELSADEKFLCNKRAKDCRHLTKEIDLLQSEIPQARRQLDRVFLKQDRSA